VSLGSQSVAKAENPFAAAFGISGAVFILLSAGLLHVLRVPLTGFALLVATAPLLWLAFRHPTAALGAVLAFMPIYPMAFLLAKFFGPSRIASLEGCDRAVLLLLVCVLWWRNGIKLKAPDWFLLACFGLAFVRLLLGGKLLPFLSDFNFIIAYAAGRTAVLTASQEKLWARRAVWTVAVLAVLGMVEVFIIGEGPRTILYLAVAEQTTTGGALNPSFHAFGYSGLRESSTMLGALHFAPLCMVGLLIWWVYFRSPLLAAMIGAGLICTVTRSAWLGTIVAIFLLAIIMGQKKRLFLYAAVALALFAVSIPVLGLTDYLSATKTVKDPSAEDHRRNLYEGLAYAADHPLGAGPGNVGRWAAYNLENDNAQFFDNTYLTFSAEYGVQTALCFIVFLLSALWLSWRQRTQMGYVAVGILAGFGVIIMFFTAHDIFPLACWIWFPVGLAVKSSGSAPGS